MDFEHGSCLIVHLPDIYTAQILPMPFNVNRVTQFHFGLSSVSKDTHPPKYPANPHWLGQCS
jgi:hypothetical protein